MYAFLDIETNGTNYDYHETIEIGLIVGVTEFECSLPFMVSRSDPKALEVNGFGVRKFAPMMDPADAVDCMYELLSEEEPTYLVGQNIRFDERFIETLFKSQGYDKMPWNFRLVELSSFVAGVLGLMPPVKSGEIIERTGIHNNSKHTALGDAQWDKEVFEWALDYNQQMRSTNVRSSSPSS